MVSRGWVVGSTSRYCWRVARAIEAFLRSRDAGDGDSFGDGRRGHFGQFTQNHRAPIAGTFRTAGIDDQDIVWLGHKQHTVLRVVWRDGAAQDLDALQVGHRTPDTWMQIGPHVLLPPVTPERTRTGDRQDHLPLADELRGIPHRIRRA